MRLKEDAGALKKVDQIGSAGKVVQHRSILEYPGARRMRVKPIAPVSWWVSAKTSLAAEVA